MKKIIIEILQNSKAEYKFITTNIPLLLVLLGGNIGYGVLYNYMYNPNIVRDVPIAVVDMADNKLSRTFIKNIDATEQVAVKHVISDYAEAETMVKENKIIVSPIPDEEIASVVFMAAASNALSSQNQK